MGGLTLNVQIKGRSMVCHVQRSPLVNDGDRLWNVIIMSIYNKKCIFLVPQFAVWLGNQRASLHHRGG